MCDRRGTVLSAGLQLLPPWIVHSDAVVKENGGAFYVDEWDQGGRR